MQMKIIAISGKAGAGKDTTATFIKDYANGIGRKVLITHYADLLKYICRTLLGWDGVKDQRGRELLQVVGTDVVRKQDPDFWVRFMSDVLTLFHGQWDTVLIPDTRFPNEIEYLRQHGFDVIHLRIIRDGNTRNLTESQMHHASETALDVVAADYIILNDKGLQELKEHAIQVYTEVDV